MLLGSPRATGARARSETRLSAAFTFDGPRGELWLTGSLDAFSLVALQASIDQLCVEPFEEVVVHVDDLDRIDASGVDALFRLRVLVEDRGARFRVAGATEPLPTCLRPTAGPQGGAVGDLP